MDMKLFETLRFLTTRPDLWALIQPKMLAMLNEWGGHGGGDVLGVTVQQDVIPGVVTEESYSIHYTIPEPECFKAVGKKDIPTTMNQVLFSARANFTNSLLTPEIVENSARIIIGDTLRQHKIYTLLLTEH